MPSRSLFISFEGGEGAGKSTLIRRLESEFLKHSLPVVITREPGGSALGEEIRKVLLHTHSSIAPMSELLLFLASRAQHIEEVIAPALKQGKIVLCDRFNDSTVAYQGIARDLGMEKVESLCQLVCGNCVPDLTLVLDLDPQEGLKRAHRDQRVLDRLETEKAAFHEAVRQGFLTLAKKHPERMAVLNADADAEAVFEQAWALLQERMQPRR